VRSRELLDRFVQLLRPHPRKRCHGRCPPIAIRRADRRTWPAVCEHRLNLTRNWWKLTDEQGVEKHPEAWLSLDPSIELEAK
jgi:hypothetical protein